jgi:hypothetical protein
MYEKRIENGSVDKTYQKMIKKVAGNEQGVSIFF